MVSDTPQDGRCNAGVDDGYCENWPMDNGRCWSHGGRNEDDPRDPGGAPEGNQHATRHGLYADPQNVLDHLAERDGDGYEWVMKKYDSYLEDAPFGDGSAKADELKQLCAMQYVAWQGIGIQIRGGLVGKGDGDTGTVADLEANPVNRPLNQLQRTVGRRLDELGIYDDADGQAGAGQDAAAAIRALMEEADSE